MGKKTLHLIHHSHADAGRPEPPGRAARFSTSDFGAVSLLPRDSRRHVHHGTADTGVCSATTTVREIIDACRTQ